MKIYKNDSPVAASAKRAAMICVYAINNPLHCSFEDFNFYPESEMKNEMRYNEEGREDNGEILYWFIRDFIEDFLKLSVKEREESFRLFKKKWSYLQNKWRKKISENSNPSPTGSLMYQQYLDDDGHIYVETDKGTKILMI